MSYIYKITNDINDKVYIGKTEFSIQKRFQEHCHDAFQETKEKRPLYAAMRKYGISHFDISLIEECSQLDSANREMYWIEQYHSYSNGYNATLGGDGKFLYNHQDIINRLQQYPYPTLVAKEFNCSASLVSTLARYNNIVTKNISHEKFLEKSKTVYQYTKDLEYVNSFPSTAEAARWCYENQLVKKMYSGIRSHIAEVANHKRKSAYGYIWRYEKI